MKTIEMLEAAREAARGGAREATFAELGFSAQIFWAYNRSREAETEILDFEDVIWEKDIPAILADCKRFEIDRFTISCGMSSMAETIWELEKQGCRLVGMARVNGRFEDYRTGARETKPAFLIETAWA